MSYWCPGINRIATSGRCARRLRRFCRAAGVEEGVHLSVARRLRRFCSLASVEEPRVRARARTLGIGSTPRQHDPGGVDQHGARSVAGRPLQGRFHFGTVVFPWVLASEYPRLSIGGRLQRSFAAKPPALLNFTLDATGTDSNSSGENFPGHQ